MFNEEQLTFRWLSQPLTRISVSAANLNLLGFLKHYYPTTFMTNVLASRGPMGFPRLRKVLSAVYLQGMNVCHNHPDEVHPHSRSLRGKTGTMPKSWWQRRYQDNLYTSNHTQILVPVPPLPSRHRHSTVPLSLSAKNWRMVVVPAPA